MEEKICTGCKKLKKLSEFHTNKQHKDEKECSCKDCKNKDTRERYKNSRNYREKLKNWTLKNKERIKITQNKSRLKNWERNMWHTAKFNANKKNREFNIDTEDITIPEKCPYLGIKLTRIIGKG